MASLLASRRVALRVPSEKERNTVVKNVKFSEHGLDMAATQKLRPSAIIYDIMYNLALARAD